MTLREKQQAMLDDLIKERGVQAYPEWWKFRLEEKIAELRAAMGAV